MNMSFVSTYLPKDIIADGKELEIDKDNLIYLRLYVPPQVIEKVTSEMLKAGYSKSADELLYKITDRVEHVIKVNNDGTIESYFKYDNLILPELFLTYSHYKFVYEKLHILYRGKVIDAVKSLYECQFLDVFDFPAATVTVFCKEPDQVPILYMHYLTKLAKFNPNFHTPLP